MKQISVIIPVYNGENFLDTCIQSVLAQQDIDMQQVEILAINDGSADTSIEILRKYAKEYPAIFRLIDQQNAGTAATRNSGIREARGEYITFVDQDDYLDPDFLITYITRIREADYDMVQGGFSLVNKRAEVVKRVMPVNSEVGRLQSIPGWAKLYKRNFLLENNIDFFANNIGEDNVFMAKVIAATNNYGVVYYAGYNNFFDNESNVTNTFHKGLSYGVNIIELLDVLTEVKAPDSKTQELLNYNTIRTAVYYLLAYGRQATASRFGEVFDEVTEWVDRYVAQLGTHSYIPFGMNGDTYAARFGIFVFFVVHRFGLVRVFARVYCIGKADSQQEQKTFKRSRD